MTKFALVTGGSSGLGKSMVELLVGKGYHVFALSRKIEPFPGDSVSAIRCDITDEDSIRQALEIVRQTTDELDVLANFAGFGISGPIETTPIEHVKQQFSVNFFGTVAITQACIPLLRARRGRILTISSVASTIPIPFQSFYSSTKSALTTWSLCLNNELKPFGIRAIVVLPGDLSTGFTDNRVHVEASDLYVDRVGKSIAKMEQDERTGKTPDQAVQSFYKMLTKKNPSPYYVLGADYLLFTWIYRLMPARFSNWVIGQLYAR